jgi:O-antigen/teichoic acid export membrane protein
MSFAVTVFKGATWMAAYKFVSQIFSWAITLLIARLLAPDDYGLMTMATMITTLGLMFNELGLGAAIIQKPKITETELSSIFWFSFFVSLLFTGLCYFSSYVLAAVFHEPRIIPLTKAASLIFLINGLQIVPMSLIKKNLEFKQLGFIEMKSVIISSFSMLIIAYYGGGVWALVGGYLILSASKLFFLYFRIKWMPRYVFAFREAKGYLQFGAHVSLGRFFFYLFEASDKFFGARAWTPNILGYYSFGLTLAQLPTDKIVTLINQVSFPALSKLQHDREGFNTFYLRIVKLSATLVMPIFIGGYLLGEELIPMILSEKWMPIVVVFKYLCLTQVITSLNAINNLVHWSQGRPQWSLVFHGALAFFMSISFYLAAPYGMNAYLFPWFITYLVICLTWIMVTIKKLNISVNTYLENLGKPTMGTLLMAVGVLATGYGVSLLHITAYSPVWTVTAKIIVGVLCYVGYLWFFDKQLFLDLQKLRQPQLEVMY